MALKKITRDSTALSHVNEAILHFLREHFDHNEVEIYGHWAGGNSISRICAVYDKSREQIERTIKKIEKRILECLSWHRIESMLAFEPVKTGSIYSKPFPEQLDKALVTIAAARVDDEAGDIGYVRQVIREDNLEGEFRAEKQMPPIQRRPIGLEREYRTSLAMLSLSSATSNALLPFCRTVEELCKLTSEQLIARPGFGDARLLEIERALELNGLSLRCVQVSAWDSSIESLNLSSRALNALRDLEVQTLSDLATISRDQLMVTRNVGERTCNEIAQAMQSRGVGFADDKSSVQEDSPAPAPIATMPE